MFYLALASREDALLLTLDGPLKKEARSRRQGWMNDLHARGRIRV